MEHLYEIALKSYILDDIDNSPLPLEVKVQILKELYIALEKYLEENED